VAEEIIEVTIRPDGKVEMRVEGMAGMGCLAATDDLAGLLGGEIETRELTPEAYQETAYQETGEPEQDRLWR
jgi:hypothetical protein